MFIKKYCLNSLLQRFYLKWNPLQSTLLKKVFLSGIAVFIFSSCVIVKEMIPKKSSAALRPEAVKALQVVNNSVHMEKFFVAGFPEPHTPPMVSPTKELNKFLMEVHGDIDLNKSVVVRYFLPNKESKNIQIIVPGIYSGAGTVCNMAEGIVMRSPDTEVWIWERRSNLLEDRRGFIKALSKNDKEIVEKSCKPGTFEPLPGALFVPKTEDIPFAGYWGLNVLLNDLYNVVKTAKAKGKKVIISGYSLGVLYTTVFLANDFLPGDGIEAGYSLVDGAILYDGPPMIDAYIKNERMYRTGVYIFPPGNFIDGTNNLENAFVFPCNTDGSGSINIFYKMECKALLAAIDPDGLSPVKYKTPLFKHDITNLASCLVDVDDNYFPFKLFTSTVGRADATHLGIFSERGFAFILSPSKGKSVIDWIGPENYDDEYNNIEKCLYCASNKDFNISEWYQPTRVLLDLGSIDRLDTKSGWQNKYFSVTENHNVNIPILAIGLTRGLSGSVDIYKNYFSTIKTNDTDIFIVGGLTHLDGDSISGSGRNALADLSVSWINKLIN